jgi:uncharacterized membrane-anchored protein
MSDPMTTPSSNRVRNRYRILAGLVLVQVLFLIGLALSFYAVGWFGKEIKIQTAPIDPRDLVYGDYVNLNYEISRIKVSLWQGSGNLPAKGDILYVVMKLDKNTPKGLYKAAAVYDHKPTPAEDEIILKGRSGYTYDEIINVTYGLETYYVPENSGKALQDQVGQLVARVKVSSGGRAVLEKIELPANK